ncbi:MAG: hypothetical protein WAR37_03785 [Candidatus Microsaccharimonas sp.]
MSILGFPPGASIDMMGLVIGLPSPVPCFHRIEDGAPGVIMHHPTYGELDSRNLGDDASRAFPILVEFNQYADAQKAIFYQKLDDYNKAMNEYKTKSFLAMLGQLINKAQKPDDTELRELGSQLEKLDGVVIRLSTLVCFVNEGIVPLSAFEQAVERLDVEELIGHPVPSTATDAADPEEPASDTSSD